MQSGFFDYYWKNSMAESVMKWEKVKRYNWFSKRTNRGIDKQLIKPEKTISKKEINEAEKRKSKTVLKTQKNRYYKEVLRITSMQDLQSLPNYENRLKSDH